MRQVKVSIAGKEKTYSIAPLKGKHIREIMEGKKPGFEETFQVLEEFAGIPKEDVDEMDFKDCLRIQKAINAETFGDEKEEKN
ncbi:phage tail assembly protein [Candidatus Saccharibacteria bacterium]|nr:phage tail assembly protein [Candidatus Saccharibacteria bacterium]